jgi:pimeloyl-ACP methyl ester carboxylesterase
MPRSLRVAANALEHHVLEWCALAPSHPAAAAPLAVRTVLLVHGFMDAAGTWDLVAPSLAAHGLRVLAPDLRGFGAAPKVAGGAYYHFADYVLDLAELVEALSPGEPVGVVGHSMGGVVATLFAGSFPERVGRLVNLEGAGPPDNPWEAGPTRMRAWVEQVRATRARAATRPPTLSRPEALARLAANHPDVAPAALERLLPHLSEEAGEGRVAWRFDPLHRTTSPTPFFARLLAEFAKRVACPVLFVSGGPRGYHAPDEDARLAAYPVCTRRELPDAGHMMHWTQPAALAALLVEHLAR